MKIDSPGQAGANILLENSYRGKTGDDFQKLLAKARGEEDDRKLREACEEIEAIFIHQMLRQMRATVPSGGLLSESNAAKIYRDMLDEEYSRIMAHSPTNMGLAEMLYKQLAEEGQEAPSGTGKEE